MAKVNSANNIFIVILLVLLCSCGTLRSPRNIVPIDSSPRGLNVTDEDGNALGITPLFYKFPKGRSHKLQVGDQKINYKCSWNWSGSLIPNNLLLLAGSGAAIGFALGFDLADLISGGLYNCHELLKITQKTSAVAPRTRRILILPPWHQDEQASDEMVAALERKIKLKNGDYVSFKEAKSYLHLNGISNFRINDPRDINEHTLRKISYKFNLTHLMFVKVVKKGSEFNLSPVIYDVFDFDKVRKLNPIQIQIQHRVKNTFLSYLLDTISFFPNAATIGYMTNPNVDIEGSHRSTDGKGQSTSRHPDSFPKILSSLGLETVHHSMFFDSWDIDFFLSPSFTSSAWKSSYSDYSINVQTYNAMFGGFVVGQTPFGQLSVGFSLGLLYLNAQDSLGRKTYKGTMGTKVSIDYKYFFGERWYLTLGANIYGLGDRTLSYQEYHLKTWTTSFVGIGYYFPEVRSLVRSIF